MKHLIDSTPIKLPTNTGTYYTIEGDQNKIIQVTDELLMAVDFGIFSPGETAWVRNVKPDESFVWVGYELASFQVQFGESYQFAILGSPNGLLKFIYIELNVEDSDFVCHQPDFLNGIYNGSNYVLIDATELPNGLKIYLNTGEFGFVKDAKCLIKLDSPLETGNLIYCFVDTNNCNVQSCEYVVGEYVTNSDYFDRLVYTDVHIAMNVNGKDGDSLYEGKWDKEEVLRRLDLMLYHVKTFKKGRKLIIDDLGDFLDGLGGQTTRKGHELPQNMNDKEAFELALEFKIKLIDNLINEYEEIICHNITNDNHSGVFSYFVSSAFEKIINCRYSGKVKVKTIKRFIDHYSVNNHTFVISHGKDIGEQKFGLKPKLDAVQAEKIDQYCKEHKLYNGNFIEFSKGDSHQAIYDDTTSNDFSYYNYPAFSPPSNWVKTNYSNTRSGFNFFNIKKDENIKISIPYWFEKQ